MTAAINAAMNASISPPTPLRVLYAEDRREDAELCLLELRRSGFQVHADLVDSAGEFVKQLRSGSHDLVLADYRLPSWTGIEAFETLKQSGADIPFILVTGTLGEEMAADCIKRGMADYVLKDRLARLPVAVRAALNERTMRRDRLRAQQEQREREAVFRLLFASNPLPMAVFDQDTLEFLEVNDAAILQYGYSRDEFMEMRVADLGPPDDVPHMRETFMRLKDRRGPLVYSNEVRHQLKNGSIIDVIINWHSLQFGSRAAILAVAHDITERKRAEKKIQRLAADLEVRVVERTCELAAVNRELELRNREVERANQMKSQFLASMSHELRTPLNAILGFSSLLAERTPGPLNEKQGRFVEHIHRGGQHLLQLINDILDLAKIEAGRMELHPERCLISEILPEVLSLILPLATAKKIRLESPASGGLAVFADPIRLKQILYNLLSNAVKFTPESGVISVAASPADKFVELSVQDTGIGIPPGELENIFNEFHQVSASTKGLKEGTGLGLAITKRFVEQHGGNIRVESELGKGSRFVILLPAHTSSVDRGLAFRAI